MNGLPGTKTWMNQYLGQAVPQAGRAGGQALATKWAGQKESELARLQRLANNRDLADIEALAELLPELTSGDRQEAIGKLRRRIDPTSRPLLDYYVRGAGQAPPVGIGTWQAPEAAKTGLMQALGGTTPGFPYELALGQLPPEQREAEMGRRTARIEPRYSRAGEVGRTMIPTGEERVLPEREAKRQRVRETPGAWADLLGVTTKWKPEQFAFEKEQTIAIAEAQGILDERGVAAAKTFIDKQDLPEWFRGIPASIHSRLGIRMEEGTAVSDLSESALEAQSQLNLRSVLSQPKPTLDELKGMANIERMRVAVFGSEMLSPAQINAIEKGTSALPSWLIEFVKEPLTSRSVWSRDWSTLINKLLRYFAPQEIAAMLSMAHDKAIREGIAAEVGFAK